MRIKFVAICFMTFCWVALYCTHLPSVSAAEKTETQAVSILTKTCEFLAETAHFSFSANISFDVVQENGQKIEYGARQNVLIARPDRARIDILRRDGSNDVIEYDGKRVILYNTNENVFALEQFSGNLNEAFEFLAGELNIPIPLEDFLATNAAEILTSKLEDGFVVGTAYVNSVACDHLAFRNDVVDFQVWIAQGEKPLPLRLVINYKNEPGQPKFIATLQSWDTAPKVSKELFSFTPPVDMERIPITVIDGPEENEGGKK